MLRYTNIACLITSNLWIFMCQFFSLIAEHQNVGIQLWFLNCPPWLQAHLFNCILQSLLHCFPRCIIYFSCGISSIRLLRHYLSGWHLLVLLLSFTVHPFVVFGINCCTFFNCFWLTVVKTLFCGLLWVSDTLGCRFMDTNTTPYSENQVSTENENLKSQLDYFTAYYTRWFKYDRDWFVCKQAALRSSYATLREWSHNLHPPSCSG